MQIKKEKGCLGKMENYNENSVFKYFPHDKRKKCDDCILCIFINSLWDPNDKKCLGEIYLKIKKKSSVNLQISKLYHTTFQYLKGVENQLILPPSCGIQHGPTESLDNQCIKLQDMCWQ